MADAPSAPASDDDHEPRLQVHGFLTQAYAMSDGETIVGITEDGTTDYRTAALQLRYRMSERASFAIQLAHERLGESPLADLRDEVELDWIFYRHMLGDYTELKVGRIPIPRGIYNEILDVGTALPFYRPPLDLYGESAFANETVDGAVLTHTLFIGDWLVDVDGYFGGWEATEFSGAEVAEATIDDAFGVQIWVRPPVPGLRVGLSGQTFEVSDGLLRAPGVEEQWSAWTASAEWSFPHGVVRSEAVASDAGTSDYTAWYGEVGVRLTPKLTLNLQVERADVEVDNPPLVVDLDYDRTEGAGLSYAFGSDLVAKVEVHHSKGYFHVDDPVPNLLGDPRETVYGILSLAASF